MPNYTELASIHACTYVMHEEMGNVAEMQKLETVLDRLKGQDRLSVIIHELLHSCYWDMDEEAIHHPAEDIARVLWRLGYRAEK